MFNKFCQNDNNIKNIYIFTIRFGFQIRQGRVSVQGVRILRLVLLHYENSTGVITQAQILLLPGAPALSSENRA